MTYNNIRIGSGKYGRFETIRPRIIKLFGGPLRRAKELNVSVKINMTPVLDAHGFADKIAKLKLENDRATLSLFLKAIKITNKAAKDIVESNIYYLLDLGKLLPKNLLNLKLERKAAVFLKTKDPTAAFNSLTKMNMIDKVMKWSSPYHP